MSGKSVDGVQAGGITSGRLGAEKYAENFADLHPPLNMHEAVVEAERCYFCYDAPCQTACPTEIDIPLFIREISTGNPLGAAKTIFNQNILGGMCARVCPTETLCEEVCVREVAEGKPVKIGQLQRYATDAAMSKDKQFYARAESTGKKVAVIGAGPAGLSCAHRLSMHGHDITIFDAREKSGGLNEYGIATYKTVDGFAQDEVDYITAIGGIHIEHGRALGREISLSGLLGDFDAVFIGAGLADVNALGLAEENIDGIEDAIEWIANLRQSQDKADVPVGRRVVVIGGGMTAIDAAIQAKLLGAEDVTICYRRGQDNMNASEYEQDLAASNGVHIRHWLAPVRVLAENSAVAGIELEYTGLKDGKLTGTGQMLTLPADQVFKAIGQAFAPSAIDREEAPLELDAGRIKVDETFQTSHPRIWAGGDCVHGGEDLTVTATAHGRDAAEAIHKNLSQANGAAEK